MGACDSFKHFCFFRVNTFSNGHQSRGRRPLNLFLALFLNPRPWSFNPNSLFYLALPFLFTSHFLLVFSLSTFEGQLHYSANLRLSEASASSASLTLLHLTSEYVHYMYVSMWGFCRCKKKKKMPQMRSTHLIWLNHNFKMSLLWALGGLFLFISQMPIRVLCWPRSKRINAEETWCNLCERAR